MNISHLVINYVRDKRLIKEFGFFIELKQRFVTSVIYKPNKLHLKLGCSRTKVNRHIKIFIDNDFAFFRDGNLCLRGFDAIHKLIKLEDKKPRNKAKVHNTDDIYLTLLQTKLNQKAFIHNKVLDLNSNSRSACKRSLKYLKERGIKKKDTYLIKDKGTSIKTISECFSITTGHTSKVIKRMAENGLISVIKRKQFAGRFNRHLFYLLKQDYPSLYRSGIFMYYNLPSIVTIKARCTSNNNNVA